MGAAIAIIDRNADAAHFLAERIEAEGGACNRSWSRFSQARQVEAAVSASLKALGPSDILFHHAGTLIVKPFLETQEEDWDWLMEVNVKSVFLMTRAVLFL